jgi:hypothetical protein
MLYQNFNSRVLRNFAQKDVVLLTEKIEKKV